MRHYSARNVIERCFGLLKMRWAILRTYSYFPIKTQFRIITACCLLHNLIQREMPMDLDDDENEEMNPPPLATELGDEMIDVVKASDQWSEWRTALATQMFNERQASRGMDDTGTTSSRKKGKPRRFWNHREEVFLITTMKDVIASNPRWKLDNNQFRAGFYNECEKKILSDFPGTDLRASPHIDSKIKFWRKQYNALQDMLNMSGFGWNDEQKMVLVDSDDIWQNYVRRVPDAKGMRNRPFPFYEDWLILFGKDRATGELAEDPADAVAAMEKEDANATTEEGEQSPVEQFSMNMGDTDYSMSTAGNVPNRADSAKTGKKRARPTEGIPTELSEMAKNLGSFIENTNTTMVEIAHRIGYSHDLSQQRRLVNAELLKLPMSNTQRLMAASMIVKDEDKVDLFFSLDENDKMEWFRAGFYNECEKKILSAFPGTDLRASPHIDSKIKFWRKQYNALQDMLNMSGFGWNDEQKMVLVDSDDVWQNYVRRVPDAKGMRNRPFPFYEDWLILFGKDRATGELAEDPADAVAAMEKEDANATTEEGEQSPVEQFSMNMGDTDYSMSTAGNVPNRADSVKTGKKRARPTEGIPTELSEMAKNLGSFIENTNTTMVEIAHRIGYSHDLSQQRRLVNAELLKLPMSNTQRLMAASMIVKDEDKVDLFFSLDENDKMEWVSLLLEGHI
ncbi:hypothetical protein HYC85_029631 [Camellia sinensis]|uniref:Myb/SANT-like domain-containing protein n=1 Tax=Camellia sinensis TaxID=4442 RepID=A0A7J7FYF9_CAMSI|nr:hypothetical protein HYC85_029631 [Camellia sinensis]